MNRPINSCLVIFVFVCASCSNSPTIDDNNADTTPDSSAITESIDTIQQRDTVKKESTIRNVADWKIADFIITGKYKSSESVKRTIECEVEEWKNVKSPLIATYKGCDMGDYFHLIFQDSAGKEYDFGFGNNQFGEYTLFDKDLIDDPKYVGKSFVIYWNWEVSSFPCCDGDYDLMEAYMPSITGLELKRN